MAEKQQQEPTLSELVVKEAVSKGMDSSMRESIVEAVEEADGSSSTATRRLPLVGALVGLSAAIGYLIGTKGDALQSEDVSLESIEEPEVIEDVVGGDDSDEMDSEMDEETDDVAAETDGSSGGRLGRLAFVLGIVGVAALVRRRMQSSEEDEWEPIEEFETAVSPESDDSSEDEEADAESEDEDEMEDEMDATGEDEEE